MKLHTLRKLSLYLGTGIFLSMTTAQAQLSTGLLNYWPMNGTADDTARDIDGSTGNYKNDGQINGSVTFTDAATEGLTGFGQVGSFPGGGGNNITIADPTDATDDIDRTGANLTISVWIKANAWDANWQGIISHGEDSDYRIARRGTNSPVLFAYAGGTGDLVTGTSYGDAPAGDGNWHHIVATTENGGVTQLYVDGVLEATSVDAPAIAASVSDNNLLCIGCNPDTGREYNGLMDDVAMWDRVLTAAEVTQIHSGGLAGNDLASLLPAPQDSDGDGLSDAWEIRYGLVETDPTGINGATGDFDNDNVDNATERDDGTFPNDPDSDDDNLTDDVETNGGVGSFVDSTNTGTDPLNKDSDGDGLTDDVEDGGTVYVSNMMTGSDPTVVDTDGDTMPDGYEITNGLDPNTDDGGADAEPDGLTNLAEFTGGTDPQVADTDGDGLDDGPEVNTHLSDPLVVDTDGDTLSDGDEVNTHMTNPTLVDTDGDFFSDAEEIAASTDPNDAASTPIAAPLPDPVLYYSFDVDNGTEVQNLGTLATAGTLQGAATYGPSVDASFGTAFVGNRGIDNDAYVATGFTGDSLGFEAGGTYTAMAWISWAGTLGAVDHMVFGQDDGAGNNPQLHHGIRDDSPANAHFGGWGAAQDIADAGTVPPDGTWTHVAWQYDGADKVVFVNGIETARAAGNNITNAALNVIIGAHGRGSNLDPAPGHSFNGSLDEVKIYNSALSSAQVVAAMTPGGGVASGITITDITYNGDPANATIDITFTSQQNVSYALFSSTDLIDFSNVFQGNITGQTGSTTVSFSAPLADKLFFRVGPDPAGP